MALDDFDFLFEDLFQYYDDNGISRIFLFQLEPFMLNSDIRHVPPRITQRLIAFHDEDNRPDLAERVIWHIDPDCLDINQAITLCQNYQLYDALIYVYTRAMRDFVSPVVELLGLIRRVQQYRKARGQASPTSANYLDEQAIEPVIMNSYKIYPYLANVLTGLTYPSEEPLPEEDAFQAKNDVYTFLFFGRSNIGEGGKLVLTSDEENGIEPTYPYVRLLLRFDPEAFLHTLDLAFEDAYLNDQTRSVSRLVIIKILLEILSSPGLSPSEITFLNIFIARNVPKYPQFIFTFIPPSVLHSILIGLAEDPDSSTREDRQLAAEYLLSAYTPHESGRILALFKEAGFYRILRSWHQQERQWSPLLLTYLQDPDMPSTAIFPSIQDVLLLAERFNKGILPRELVATVFDSLPTLLLTNIANTAALLDKHLPSAHDRALETLGPNADHERFVYLRYLLGPPLGGEDDDELVPLRQGGPSTHVSPSLRQLYISLQCRYDPSSVITVLRYLPRDFLDVAQVTQTCEENEVFDGVIWLIDRDGDPRKALAKADLFDKQLSARLADELTSSSAEAEENVRRWLHALESIAQTATSICLERSQPGSGMEVPLEDVWFQLLRSEIDSVQRVAGCCSLEALSPSEDTSPGRTHVQLERETLSALRSLVQRTFASLMSVSSTKAVSFPRLFKRLVGSASKGHVSKGTLYTEFRTILTGMLESFRSEGDMLVITKHLVDRDLFGTIEQLAHERVKGWAPSQGACYSCGEAFFSIKKPPTEGEPEPGSVPIVVSRTGAIYHSRCLPPDLYANHSSNVQ
ncbi:Vacuolar protein sorting-associated protein 8 [Grifola frondosa]|uniref:Vacuolar protein sorting-associated protein 8 n=1 Tax=Grifola frondosa TaxID=5627 RepID=A0A1C7M2B9_GRIFR|nr:Vacuolar protein sorting-associated protein 8 [Grifola frondosa]